MVTFGDNPPSPCLSFPHLAHLYRGQRVDRFSSGCGSGNAVVGKGTYPEAQIHAWLVHRLRQAMKNWPNHARDAGDGSAHGANFCLYERPVEDAAEREPLVVSVRIPMKKGIAVEPGIGMCHKSLRLRPSGSRPEESTIKKRGSLSSPGQDGSSGGGTNGMAIGFILAFSSRSSASSSPSIGLGRRNAGRKVEGWRSRASSSAS